MTVEELLADLWEEDELDEEVFLALALLLEVPGPDHQAEVAQLIGAELASRPLTPAERDRAVDGLIDYLQTAWNPLPSAAWALGKCREPRVLPALIELLEAALDDPDAAELAYQAVIGITNWDLGEPQYQAERRAAVQRAAASGQGRTAETAQDYLDLSSGG